MLKQKPFKVLFVCIGNSCRSPMAEAIAGEIAGDVIEPSSAGLAPLGYVAELTQRVLVANGYSADELASKPILQEVWDCADLVVNMSGRPREMVFKKFAKVEDWDIEDPYGEDMEVYQRILLEIEGRVRNLAQRLRTMQKKAAERYAGEER